MTWYFEPLKYILSGVVVAAALQVSNKDMYMQREVQESFVNATKIVLILTSRFTNYAGMEMLRALFEDQSDEEIVEELIKFFTSNLIVALKDFKQCLEQSRPSVFDKTVMLQPLAEVEKRLPSLPIIYSALTATFSGSIYTISRDFLQRNGGNTTYLEKLLAASRACDPSCRWKTAPRSPPPLCDVIMMPRTASDFNCPLNSITIGFLTSVLVDVEKAVRDNLSSLPPSLSKIPASMQVISSSTWLHYSHANKSIAASNLHAIITKIRGYLRRTVDSIVTHNISSEELSHFRDSPVFVQIAETWLEGGGGGAVTEHFPVIATELAAGFAQNERIRNTLRFLSERSMLSAGIEDTLRMNADWLSPPTNKSNLSNIISINESLMRMDKPNHGYRF